jgi:hypothetical protein
MTKLAHFVGFMKFLLQNIKISHIVMWFNMILSISTWFMGATYLKWALIYYLIGCVTLFVYWFIIQPIIRSHAEYTNIIDKL